jgi:hypothetical protein
VQDRRPNTRDANVVLADFGGGPEAGTAGTFAFAVCRPVAT